MIEALLNLLFNRSDIINYRVNPEGELYLRRWFIYPRVLDNTKMKRRLYLHKFYTGDTDRHLHDHPWSFKSLILWNGYFEVRFNPEWLKWQQWQKFGLERGPEPPQTLTNWYGPGSLLTRGAAWAHSVKLATNGDGSVKHAWSLVWTSAKERSWGFHTEQGWCWWRKYDHGVCICEDGSAEEKVKP
jgi:hypothetical protein